MSSFPILDLVAGILFVYFVLSIISSSAVEMIMAALRIRADVLRNWLMTIFDKPIQTSGGTVPLGQAIMDHCSVTALSGQGKAPSYIAAKNFVSALLEKISFDPNQPDEISGTLDEITAKIKNSTALSNELKRVLLTYAVEAKSTYASLTIKVGSELDLFTEKAERWFDSSMDRITGTLKTKYIRKFTLLVGIVTTLLMNADSIAIAKHLYNNPEARRTMAEMGYSSATLDSINQRIQMAAAKVSDTSKLSAEELVEVIKERNSIIKDAEQTLSSSIPLGWSKADFTPAPGGNMFTVLISKIIGLAATVLAIMMGAPFWFDVLNKVSNLRSTGKPPKPEVKA